MGNASFVSKHYLSGALLAFLYWKVYLYLRGKKKKQCVRVFAIQVNEM